MSEEKFTAPPVGSTVTVCTVWPAPSGTPGAVQFNTYFREVVIPGMKWDEPKTFRLRTRAPEFLGDAGPKERVITLSRVKTLVVNGKNVHRVAAGEKPKTKPKARRVTVMSSKGDKTYTVTVDGNKATCTCPGFGFRRKCRHVTEVLSK